MTVPLPEKETMHLPFRTIGMALVLGAVLALLSPQAARCQRPGDSVRVDVRQTLDSLLRDEDTDNDRKITIEDQHIAGTARGDKRFWINTVDGRRYEVAGTYYLANLLEELKLLEEAGRSTAVLEPARIFAPPVDRLSYMIRRYFWDGLTRRVDTTSLSKIIADEKTTTVDGYRYVYVPPSDPAAFSYFSAYADARPEGKFRVVSLSDSITGRYVRGLDGRHGLLTLALRREADGYSGVPFVVPGGRFNEMYGWDSYFITLGLLQDGRLELAKAMVDNFVYEIAHYGKILNANRTYYLTRSQPPFLTSMIRAVYARLPKNDASRQWLRIALDAAIREYETVWMGKDHLTKIGLSRYFDTGYGPPPETEPGHFDPIYAPFARNLGMNVREFEQAYLAGRVKVAELDTFFVHDRAMRESGHDTSYRLIGVCADLTTVDLNALLYAIERDIAEIIRQDFRGSFRSANGRNYTTAAWLDRAARRRELVDRYLWDPASGIYLDYDVATASRRPYVSATSFYPLWAKLASKEQAASLVRRLLPQLEMPGGIVASTEESRGPVSQEHPQRQWDYPNGWAPHQMLVWQGMINYGYDSIAQRLIYRWLYTITSNAADYNGTVPEKFDLVKRSHQVFAEYGNVGTTFSYITREGFGWTNASYEVGLNLLPDTLRMDLNRLIPPEWVFR